MSAFWVCFGFTFWWVWFFLLSGRFFLRRGVDKMVSAPVVFVSDPAILVRLEEIVSLLGSIGQALESYFLYFSPLLYTFNATVIPILLFLAAGVFLLSVRRWL